MIDQLTNSVFTTEKILLIIFPLPDQVSQETTIGNSNLELLKYITATGVVLEWMRTILANRLASTTVEWAYMFSRHNSGT